MSALRSTTAQNALRRATNGGQVQLPKLRMSSLPSLAKSRMRARRWSSNRMTSVFGAPLPRRAAFKKSSLWPCHTALRDSRLNRRLESETHRGGSSASPSRSFIRRKTLFLMQRKSSSQNISAAARKRGSSTRQTTAFLRAFTVFILSLVGNTVTAGTTPGKNHTRGFGCLMLHHRSCGFNLGYRRLPLFL